MPVSYEIDRARRLAITTATGEVTVAEFQNNRAAILSDPELEMGMNQLVDLRQVGRLRVTGAEVREFARSTEGLPFLSPDSRTAIVTASAEGFGLARMYELSRSQTPETVQVF